ncbi:PREDICTED: quinolinate synthase, chloroplastic [Tarenaya hassleriana]|uniref:quinolinate synthase, chloroplastic n=1 Tax=Tarenaya hassleriana TaxID=28532 RepID=UPI00053C7122|nr:PREDICTED: quinolinate synthase, chloroplastic [Tarenaya hassleriana]
MELALSLKAADAAISPSSSFSLYWNPNPSLTRLRSKISVSPCFRPFQCVRSSSPDHGLVSSVKPTSRDPITSPFSCSAVASSSSETTCLVLHRLQRLVAEFQSLMEPVDRVKWILHHGSLIPPMPESSRTKANRVMGCMARVWLDAELDQDGKMRFWVDSDSDITKGLCSCLIQVVDSASPEEVMGLKTEDLAALNVGLLGTGERSRVNTWHNVLVSMQKRTRRLVAEREGQAPAFEPFPSLVVTADGIEAKGSYAEAQAKFLSPNETRVQELVNVLKEKKIGVVAHFYMDPEVQGVLTAAQKYWPHIHISDSLVMADTAVNMAKAGCEFITVLGVDFMSENVRAILDQAGFGKVGVYRLSDERIGCSLADAASAPSYLNYLEDASSSSPSLHVIYINTSLETKAFTHELVPTITCTSSNVVQTILQAFAQIPELNVWYGPDSYMGANLVELLQQMTLMTDEEIASIHPKHNRDSITSLLPRLHYFQEGTCIVHHLFGHEVVERIKQMYCDAFLTAHLEVPGEMFSLAMEAKRRGMGVVGSTQNILDFIRQRVQEALDRNTDDHLQFVLGTESGMVTSIVSTVRNLLSSAQSKVKVEVVFPVSSDSMTKTSASSSESPDSIKVGDVILPVVPGVTSGEGCSIHGGCASCPYMKMNSLNSLLKVCHNLPDEENTLGPFKAERFKLQTPQGKLIADVGCEPILHMRHFQANKELSDDLVHQILGSWDRR